MRLSRWADSVAAPPFQNLTCPRDFEKHEKSRFSQIIYPKKCAREALLGKLKALDRMGTSEMPNSMASAAVLKNCRVR